MSLRSRWGLAVAATAVLPWLASACSDDATGSGGAGGGGAAATSIQENHTFDSYFGNYCTAPTGTNPSCSDGPSCCEAAPALEPKGHAPTVLDDGQNGGYDPNHSQTCELDEIHAGAMDQFAEGASCSNAKNFAVATASAVQPYFDLAAGGALADRYFQPIAGQSSSNDMYFATARYAFTDNDFKPNTSGKGCTLPAPTKTYSGVTTIGDLLIAAGHRFAFYAEGYQAMKDAFLCPAAPLDCPFHLPTTPCDYDPSDVPFQYFEQFADNSTYMLDYAQLQTDLASGNLAEVVFIKAVGYHNEHPGYGTTISAGSQFVTSTLAAVFASPVASSTLVLVTWDEGGGYFDHVAPPQTSAVDQQPYGTRVPLLAIGRFAAKNHVSHVPMEHSSIVKFIEWNFLQATGQLGARDAVVNDIGSLLDPSQTLVPPD